ncbi:hypothetical protein CFR78_11160 [Komagataeibacter rhaeticus]|uniref:Uncharacterized protein n=1 Tax=Komagataeibacter rhaeticus TaxID=215221 RepID=A0A181CE49_9PROT|nr:hypothetical protein [Komagataeibacter rhaeticus]ATU71535.1 hypothetical protein CT154_00405 [Komagataeibacter xylinus]EGG78124.1 hypothetical protein SXCC_01519 [Gluconacetobacter sp. SXCC-1]KDU96674.1 hypothetical protein GLUCORHAEAF1_00265 [Komagataeibacter rhaeticus AF1]MBL7239699.1 hypothetical protein [Komagataeibacter rhaeticus]PYD53146.1 hypothetical protein CFR78_11160 [Komagataeibacter rhaeticus]
MRELRTAPAAWHLQHSRPENLVSYLDPWQPVARQLDMLAHRFSTVKALCDAQMDSLATENVELAQLRDALAFHLLRACIWWQVDFSPRAVTGLQATSFMKHVRRHTDRVVDDETLLDVMTWQHYMHRADSGHIMVTGTDPLCRGNTTIVYGIDGHRGFRFAMRRAGQPLSWNDITHTDFVAACLNARALHCLIETECAAIGEWDLAREEHIQASRYHTQHFRTAGHFNAVESYATALEQLSRCQSRFGRFEFENIVNHMAFSVIMAAHEQGASIADLLRNGAARPVSSRVAGSLKKRARAHVATGTDPLRRTELDALLDQVETGFALSGGN